MYPKQHASGPFPVIRKHFKQALLASNWTMLYLLWYPWRQTFFFISKEPERRQERKWVEQGREEYMSVEVEIWLTSLHSCRSLWDSSTWLRLNCVPDINKGVSVRADQQLRGSSRGPDWGLSSEGKDLTQNRYKICKGGHGLGIKDWRGEAITPETPWMTKLEGRRWMCQFHRFTSSHILHQSQLV